MKISSGTHSSIKNICRLTVIIIFVFLLLPATSVAKTWYVSKSGNDLNPGTLQAPFLTLAKPAGLMTAGDSCLIMEGIYRENLQPANSGTSISPIVFKAREDDRVIITGTEAVSSWEYVRDNIYRTKISMPLGDKNMVFCNGVSMDYARWPNNSDRDPFTLEAVPVTSGTLSSVTNGDIPDLNWKGGIIWYLGAHSGTSLRRTITAYDHGKRTVYFNALNADKWPASKHNPTLKENGNYGRFYLTGVPEALDAPGEWYYDNSEGFLYFFPPTEGHPGHQSVEVTGRGNAASLKKNYIILEGLNFFGARLDIQGNQNIIRNCRVKYGASPLENNKDASSGDASVYIRGDFNTIVACLIENGTTNGVLIPGGADDNEVRNNIVRSFNTLGIHANPVLSTGNNFRLLNNTVSHGGRDGVTVSGYGSAVGFNDISRSNLLNSDGGAFYVVGNDNDKNVSFHHNWVHDVYAPRYSPGKATGIYLDNDSKGYRVHHNVVWNIQWGGLHMNWDAWNNKIYNNTFWNTGENEAQFLCWVPYQDGAQTNVRDNSILNNVSDTREWWSSHSTSDVSFNETLDNDFRCNIQTDSLPFEDFLNRNFMPLAGSPLIDSAILIPDYNDDFIGAGPDLGAYELGGDAWVPGADWSPEDFTWYDMPDEFAIDTFLVTVKLISSRDSSVIAGGNVEISSLSQVTNASGEAAFRMETGGYVMGADAPEFEPGTSGWISIVSDTVFIIALNPVNYTLNFSVLDQESAEPIYAGSILIDGRELITKTDGRAQILLPSGEYPYIITKAKYDTIYGVARILSDTSLTFYQEKIYADVKFRIISGGSKVYDAIISIKGDNLTSNLVGIAVFKNIRIDSLYSYSVRRNGYFEYAGELMALKDTTIEVYLEAWPAGIGGDGSGIEGSGRNLFRVYPVPFSEYFYIESPGEGIGYMYNSNGLLVKSFTCNPGVSRIRTAELPGGIYLLRFAASDLTRSVRIIK